MKYDVVVVGGGPAGLAAAVAAKEAGAEPLLLEREDELGGILNQCVHNGFGLNAFGEELTGPEYAARWEERARLAGVECRTGATVLSVSPRRVTAVSAREGLFGIETGAVVLACGCRERPRGAVRIAGDRPAGVYTAGTAQKMVNRKGVLPGKDVVVLGSGDIGLIMARRMTYEGARVRGVFEIMPYSSGLKRNVVQCVEDFGIPLRFSTTVVRVNGKSRVESVTVAAVDGSRRPIAGTEETIPCDALLLSVGLLPENELARACGVPLSAATGGAEVDENMMTEIPGIFSCGNVLHVHDLADYVSEESAAAGRRAAEYALGKTSESGECVPVTAGDGVRYVVPQRLQKCGRGGVTLRFRVSRPFARGKVTVSAGGETIYTKNRPVLAPGEMETVRLSEADAAKIRAAGGATVRAEGEERE